MSMNVLISKLNPFTRGVLEQAVLLCNKRRHCDIEVEHSLRNLMEAEDSDFFFIVCDFGVDTSGFLKEITTRLDGLGSGALASPMLGLRLMEMVENAWLLASLEYNTGVIRSGHILRALTTDRILINTLIPDVSTQVLEWMAAGVATRSVRVNIGHNGAFSYRSLDGAYEA